MRCWGTIMADVPEAYQRIRESRVESIIKKHLAVVSPLSRFLFEETFPEANLVAVSEAKLHVDRDHRNASGDPLAYGETDIEITAVCDFQARANVRLALVIETKVDARQAEYQGLRYRARAEYRKQIGSWDDFRSVLVAPRRYLESAYPLDDFHNAGWDHLLALEDISKILKRTEAGSFDSTVINQAVEPTNAWNKPISGAAQFWNDLSRFQRALYPDVPIFINRQQGAGIFVWPSFYENQLANNPRELRRKRVQIVHSGKTHVALYIKNMKFADFSPVVQPLLKDGIQIGTPGTAWQSVNAKVPLVDPQVPLDNQLEALDKVFEAVGELYDFFIQNEKALLCLRAFK